jgi:hypothetical protein
MRRISDFLSRLRSTPSADPHQGGLDLAERLLIQRGTDRASLAWAAGTLLRHSPDARLRAVAATALSDTALPDLEPCQ